MNSQLLQPHHMDDHARWHAELHLKFVARADHTVLATRRHTGPLLVQRPFYPEGDVCHVYLVHPPGGVVGGDQLHLQVQLQAGSHALITTPAATKFYRSSLQRQAVVQQHLELQQAALEWLPQESIFFNHANVRMRTRIDVDAQSRFIGWEMNCYGRLACNEAFATGNLHQAFELWRDGHPVLLDRLHIDGEGAMHQAAWGLAGKAALGTLLSFPATLADVQAVRECGIDATQISCTVVDEVLVCRCLSVDSRQLKQQLLKVWQCLRPRVMKREAVLPRIWAT